MYYIFTTAADNERRNFTNKIWSRAVRFPRRRSQAKIHTHTYTSQLLYYYILFTRDLYFLLHTNTAIVNRWNHVDMACNARIIVLETGQNSFHQRFVWSIGHSVLINVHCMLFVIICARVFECARSTKSNSN